MFVNWGRPLFPGYLYFHRALPWVFPGWPWSLHLAWNQFSIFKTFLSLQAGHEAGSITASERFYYWGDKCHANTIVIINNFSRSVKGPDIINCISRSCSMCGSGLNAEQTKGFVFLLAFLVFGKKCVLVSWNVPGALSLQQTSHLCKPPSLPSGLRCPCWDAEMEGHPSDRQGRPFFSFFPLQRQRQIL